MSKKRKLNLDGSDLKAKAVHDLKSFCTESVDCFLEEAHAMLKAAQDRQKLNQWDKALAYQRIVHQQLKRLVRVADLQLNNGGIDGIEPGANDKPDDTEENTEKVTVSDDNERSEAQKVVGPSGFKAKWTDVELDKLYVAAQKYGPDLSKDNIMLIASSVGSKSAIQCLRKLKELSVSEEITHKWISERLQNFAAAEPNWS